ncbi:hypothetical protein ATO6_18210 [Oceanicola sp. 22II-s10i]|uniref:sensor histidine kinase n=1 Tax=Oceanicola sp. 22II-s10i TaxID=1317116 RepID=UPI000B526ED6|nr:HAMP domain-containing sensor histidine kinase [Oceanicola sp. 22II-s10i]OWU83393.1 hypothetical protein ATO6_18210 [Oceanicola sp. 22II-s10i]
MRTYEFLARKNFPRTYTGKVLFVSFVGVHVPMFGAVTYALLADNTPFMEQIDVLIAMLVATLVGTAGTMFLMNELLAPVRVASDAARDYLETGRTPRLPTRYTDGAGVLLASTQEAITRLDGAVTTAEAQRDRIAQHHNARFSALAGMSHDFRTPLTVIQGFAQLMKSEAISPYGGAAYRDVAKSIEGSSEQLMSTLQAVLDLSQAEARTEFDATSESLDIVRLADRAVSQSHFHADRRGVRVAVTAPEVLFHDTSGEAFGDLVGAMLQAGISAVPEGGEVGLDLESIGGTSRIRMTAFDAALSVEDVPVSLKHTIGGLSRANGDVVRGTGHTTPMTLRLSLIESFCHAMNGKVRLEQSDDGFSLTVDLLGSEESLAIAAE